MTTDEMNRLNEAFNKIESELIPTDDKIYKVLKERGHDVNKIREEVEYEYAKAKERFDIEMKPLMSKEYDLTVWFEFDLRDDLKEEFYHHMTSYFYELIDTEKSLEEIENEFESESQRFFAMIFKEVLDTCINAVAASRQKFIEVKIKPGLKYQEFRSMLFDTKRLVN